MQTNSSQAAPLDPDGLILMLTRAMLAIAKEHGAPIFSVGVGEAGVPVMGAHVPLSADAARALVEKIEAEAELDGYMLFGSVGEEQVTQWGKARPVGFVAALCSPPVVH
jgi:hypothetical protein